MRYACPRCANRSLEIREDPEGVEAWWCSICYTAWHITNPWSDKEECEEAGGNRE